MLVISSREFRVNQKKYFDLIDNNEQVIVQRGKNRACFLKPVTDSDIYFAEPEIKLRLEQSIAEAERDELISVNKEDLKTLLGL
ncbi:MAG: prevent-host-death protein [Bacteroidales bacterium]|nr:prevent-host-death protein [Bacteroidales bacterium]